MSVSLFSQRTVRRVGSEKSFPSAGPKSVHHRNAAEAGARSLCRKPYWNEMIGMLSTTLAEGGTEEGD